jgi:hypothetical protein
MAITNRDLDSSQQKIDVQVGLGGMATGVTRLIFVAPFPCTVVSASAYAFGVSNAMQLAFQRITASGQSIIALGVSNMVLGNSGVFGYSGLQAPGNTLMNLAAKDVVQVVSSVTNGNAVDLHLHLVIQKTQDIVSFV